jgi:hypothetical protein
VEFAVVVIASCVFTGALVCLIASMLWCYHDLVHKDRVDPYRDGLDTAARISAMGFEAERAMHEAAQQASREDDER